MEKIEKVLKKSNHSFPGRVFASHLTMLIMEKADIEIEVLQRLQNDGFKSTKDFAVMRKLMNAALIKGPPITGNEPLDETEDIQEKFARFLSKSRAKSTKAKLKEKRSPKL